MTTHSTTPTPDTLKNLRLGTEAARSGQFQEARAYLTRVLDQDPDNILALFWMAFVAPSPQESITLLEQVLALEPDNERARAGIRWAEQRMQPDPAESPDEAGPMAQADGQSSDDPPDEFGRQQLLSDTNAQKRARKSALAHRARRTIDPLLAVVIVLSSLILLATGVGFLLFGPPPALAVWFPLSSSLAPVGGLSSTGSGATLEGTEAEQLKTSAADPAMSKESTPSQVSHPSSNRDMPEPSQSDQPVAEEENRIELQSPAESPPSDLDLAPQESLVSPVVEDTVEDIVEEQAPPEPVESTGPAEQLFDGLLLFQPVDESRLAHQPASPDEKWIEVNVTEQRVTAWEGNVPVMSFVSSTGLPNTPTVLGKFNIYWKLTSTLMTGPGYYLPEVPYTMYFYAGYALHGAYWHNNFGQPMSHGCVNLSPDNAKKLFDWADPVLPAGHSQVVSTADNPGTLVVVHD